MRSYRHHFGKLSSSTATRAGTNDPWNHKGWTWPSIIVHRRPAVTWGTLELSEQISAGAWSLVFRCLCSKVCAQKGVISSARSQLLVGEWWWDNNKKQICLSCIWTRKRQIPELSCTVPMLKSRVMAPYVSVAHIVMCTSSCYITHQSLRLPSSFTLIDDRGNKIRLLLNISDLAKENGLDMCFHSLRHHQVVHLRGRLPRYIVQI